MESGYEGHRHQPSPFTNMDNFSQAVGQVPNLQEETSRKHTESVLGQPGQLKQSP